VVDVTGLPEHYFRHESGRLTARLVRKFGARELPRIEDAVQTALLRSVTSYTGPMAPENVSAWLYAVARNALMDELRRRKRWDHGDEALATLPSSPAEESPLSGEIEDSELRLLFVCADESLSENARLVLALKLLSGLSTTEIAARLFLNEANVQKLLERGRTRLAELWEDAERDDFLSPTSESLIRRLDSVLGMLHLLFTSGHASQEGPNPIRRELCTEALRLLENLAAHDAGQSESTWALLSVFHFHLARLDTRTSGDRLVLLRDQDRSLWDRNHIELGFYCLYRSGEGQTQSRYQFEAVILAEHCSAPTFAQTRWDEIVRIYESWEKLSPSPWLTLNRAIALAEWQGPEVALQLLKSLSPPSWLHRYYLWDATLSELSRRAGQFDEAIRFGETAITLAPNSAERALFTERVARARASDRTP
jgi:RNA polymerase sigma factor (sigma-70 family)